MKTRWALAGGIGTLAILAGIMGPDQYRIWQAKRQVATMMRDPDSAVFDRITLSGRTVCGTVNARNGYGAMAGAVPFIANEGEAVQLAPEEPASDEAKDSMKRLCDSQLELAIATGSPGDARNASACQSYREMLLNTRAYLTWMIKLTKTCPAMFGQQR